MFDFNFELTNQILVPFNVSIDKLISFCLFFSFSEFFLPPFDFLC